ncbi:hypothetical protein MRX96_051641, partial [Rhipicephalus microplus]
GRSRFSTGAYVVFGVAVTRRGPPLAVAGSLSPYLFERPEDLLDGPELFFLVVTFRGRLETRRNCFSSCFFGCFMQSLKMCV